MYGQLASGARCLNCVLSVHLDHFVVYTSSEDPGQCAHVCAHMRTLARVFIARNTKNMCTCVNASMYTCADITC